MQNSDASPAPACAGPPVEEGVRSPEGVDLTLIHWMLSMTPAGRLEALQGFLESVAKVKGERIGA